MMPQRKIIMITQMQKEVSTDIEKFSEQQFSVRLKNNKMSLERVGILKSYNFQGNNN